MKRLLVCIKQVPESESLTEPSEDGSWVQRHRNVGYRMNRYDEYALEEALQIRASYPQARIDIITVGPERALQVIKRGLGMGADAGYHIRLDDDHQGDPFVIASLIADHCREQSYDLVLTGIMSEDMMQAQTGQTLAALLDLPCGSSVVALDARPDEGVVRVEREVEGGERDLIEMTLPCVCTIQAGINSPRYPTLSNILKADSREITVIKGAPGPSRQRVVKVSYPDKSRAGRRLEGTSEEKAGQLIDLLHQRSVIRG